jgi:hypothetical protein
MSCIAFFYLLPTDKMIGLREVWPDHYKYLDKHAEEPFEYEWSGWCISSLIEFLARKKKIKFSDSDYELLFPGAADRGNWFLDKTLKDLYYKQLDPELFSDRELNAALEWTSSEKSKDASSMREGLSLIHESFKMVNKNAVMILRLSY